MSIFTQDKQNEACYLQEHKEDLIEELAATIVQKVWHVFVFSPGLFSSQNSPGELQLS